MSPQLHHAPFGVILPPGPPFAGLGDSLGHLQIPWVVWDSTLFWAIPTKPPKSGCGGFEPLVLPRHQGRFAMAAPSVPMTGKWKMTVRRTRAECAAGPPLLTTPVQLQVADLNTLAR